MQVDVENEMLIIHPMNGVDIIPTNLPKNITRFLNMKRAQGLALKVSILRPLLTTLQYHQMFLNSSLTLTAHLVP